MLVHKKTTFQRRMRNLPEEIQEALQIALPLGVAETEAVAWTTRSASGQSSSYL